MAKFNLQQFLLAKGEKIGLGLAAGGLGLLGLWGVSNLISAKSPSEVTKNFEKYKSNIDSKIKNNDAAGVTPIPEWANPNALDSKPIGGESFPVEYYVFEPVDRPSRARDNPIVLGIKEAQLDLVRLNMKAYDIKSDNAGGFRIGVLKAVSISGEKVDRKTFTEMFRKSDIKSERGFSSHQARNSAAVDPAVRVVAWAAQVVPGAGWADRAAGWEVREVLLVAWVGRGVV